MKRFLLAALIAGFAGTAFSSTCSKMADKEKLTGDARKSYLSQCKKDLNAATKTCDADAAKQALDGDRKSSFMTKCVNEAMAAKKK